MAQHGNPQSIGSERLEDAGNPDPRRRDRAAERNFDEGARPDNAARKSDAPDDDGDAQRDDADGPSHAREDDASTGR